MELHLLHRNPLEAARLLTDSDVVDMVVRVASYMSTAYTRWGEARYDGLSEQWLLTENDRPIYPPKPTECLFAQWTCETPENYRWMRTYLEGLLREYQRRYGDAKGKVHRTHDLLKVLWNPPVSLTHAFEATPQPGLMTAWPDALACWKIQLVMHQRNGLVNFKDPISRHRYVYRQLARGEYRHDPRPDFMDSFPIDTFR